MTFGVKLLLTAMLLSCVGGLSVMMADMALDLRLSDRVAKIATTFFVTPPLLLGFVLIGVVITKIWTLP